ncbi:hypothetical protein SAY87_016322 [Trapa incisa]|nr:hypothetical protein SAY87_016322 [Trapa incisa]
MEGMGNMSNSTTTTTTMSHKMGYTHMTFFWGKNSEILFPGWPATRTGMYVIALFFCFFLALLLEWISHCRYFKLSGVDSGGLSCKSPPSRRKLVVIGLVQTATYGLRVGIAYLLMLAVMSFNGGVLLVTVAGHAVGFFFFGSYAFKSAAEAASGKGVLAPDALPCC